MNVIDLLSKKLSKYSATLADIPCSELQNELKRRKEENYQKKVKEANARADKIEYLINQIQTELKTSNTNENLIEVISEHLMENSYFHSYLHRDDAQYNYTKGLIETMLRNMLTSQDGLPYLLVILKQNVRKNLINAVHKEC